MLKTKLYDYHTDSVNLVCHMADKIGEEKINVK